MDIARTIPPCLRVGILNDGQDTISLLSEWLQLHGHVPLAVLLSTVRKHSDHRPAQMVAELKADVVIFDVGMPYAVNWYYAEMIALALPAVPFVLTTANRTALEAIVGRSGAFELTGTNVNLTELLRLVYEAAHRGAKAH